jgi:predicted metal-dependent RNase
VPPRCVFITHGEEKAATSFARLLNEKTGWTVKVPEYKDTVKLA